MSVVDTGSSIGRLASPTAPPTPPVSAARRRWIRTESFLGCASRLAKAIFIAAASAFCVAAAAAACRRGGKVKEPKLIWRLANPASRDAKLCRSSAATADRRASTSDGDNPASTRTGKG